MGLQQIDQETLKSALKELIQEDPQFFIKTLKEVIAQQQESTDERKERMKRLIQMDFDEFEDTFKALA